MKKLVLFAAFVAAVCFGGNVYAQTAAKKSVAKTEQTATKTDKKVCKDTKKACTADKKVVKAEKKAAAAPVTSKKK